MPPIAWRTPASRWRGSRELAGNNNTADLISAVAGHPGVDAIAARRRIADAVIRAGRHPF
jgi:hypothetical protein